MLKTAILGLVLASTAQSPNAREAEMGPSVVVPSSTSQRLTGDLRQSGRDWVLSQARSLKLPVSSTIGQASVFGTRFGAALHFNQQVGGIDIYGAKVIVTIDNQRRVRFSNSSVFSYERAMLTWRIPPEQAMALAARDVSLPALRKDGTPYGGFKRLLFPRGQEAHAGYLIHIPTVNPAETWYLAVSAVTGEILWKENRVYHSSAADIYPFSPGGLDAGVGITPVSRVELRHADGGSMVLDTVSLPLQDGGTETFTNDAGYLFGTQINSVGCCPAQGCSDAADAGPRIVTGNTSMGGFSIDYELAVCDRVQRASNDINLNPLGGYVYEPIDAPSGPVLQSSLSDSDPFSEVHTFFHVNKIYDWFRALSESPLPNHTPFELRDAKRSPPRKLTTWSNVTLPDFNDAFSTIFSGKLKTDKLSRIDNAAFLPRESLEQLPLPGLADGADSDALMLFQGTQADFGYDAPVVWHEFGHAVITSTANFSAFRLDTLSANNEGGALHEALADYFAVAYGNRSVVGEYVGPRLVVGNGGQISQQITGLRDANNAYACPDVLWGEVHQDAMHVTGALWEARQTHFLGDDNGNTFDAAVFAALVAMTPTTHFESAAEVISETLALAFPNISDAQAKMQAIFEQRGVTNCSKVFEVTTETSPRPYFAIPGRQEVGVNSGIVPGPFQFKLKTPRGTRSVSFSASFSSGPLGGDAPSVELLARRGSTIQFTRSGLGLSNTAEATATAIADGSNLSATVELETPCAETSEVYVALGTQEASSQTLQEVTVTFEPAETCQVEDAGVVVPEPTVIDAVPSEKVTASHAGGCGCTSGRTDVSLLAFLALAAIRRRQHRTS